MTLTLPVGNLAFSVELKVRRRSRRVVRSGVEWDGGSSDGARRQTSGGGRHFDPNVDKMRAEAFVQLFNRRLA